MSLLIRQHAMAAQSFLTRYPHWWLVWEPGDSSVPVSGVDVSIAVTQVPGHSGSDPRPLSGDALCFPLKASAPLTVGRAADTHLVLSDLTVSRLHARLEPAEQGWSLFHLSTTKATSSDGRELPAGSPLLLRSGQSVQLGGVTVSIYDPPAFKQRVVVGP